MTLASAPPAPHPAAGEMDVEQSLPAGWGAGAAGRALYWVAVAFSTFQIATSVYAILPQQSLRAIHVGFLVLVGCGLIANHLAPSRALWALGWIVGLTGFAVGLYHWYFYFDLVNRSGYLTHLDIAVGVAGMVILFAVSWRLMGAALPIICLVFVAYGLFGQYLPRPLDHRGFAFDLFVEQLAFGTEGIYATPTGVSATYIYLFILFGAFLERAGMIQLFNDVALGLCGTSRGGAAKVSVVSSAMMGTISGSGVANVVTVGNFTIPLMKRYGYGGSFAGGVEATASMGGQIMPPVMGAVAFIMAENIGVPYSEIVKAAIIPAILYFASAFWMVHLEAAKRDLKGIPRSELPSALAAMKRQWHLMLPLVVLIVLLMDGFTPLFAGSVGLGLTVAMILTASAVLALPPGVMRVIFWIGVGLIAGSLLKYGVVVMIALVAALVVFCAFLRGGRETLVVCRDVLAEGARQALPVGLACAIVGTVIGVLSLTGTASTFGNYIVSFGRDNLFFCLVLIMLSSLILGTGLPTIPTYIITAALAAPALYKLGVPLIVSHMFVFYFGIIADLTPPVALAALAAAPIAKATPDAIGWQASRIALAGFLIPFMAVYDPSLMLQAGGAIAQQYGYWVEVAWVFFKASTTIYVIGVAAIGYLFTTLNVAQRILAIAAICAFIAPLEGSNPVAFTLTAIVTAWNWRSKQRADA